MSEGLSKGAGADAFLGRLCLGATAPPVPPVTPVTPVLALTETEPLALPETEPNLAGAAGTAGAVGSVAVGGFSEGLLEGATAPPVTPV